MPLPRRFSATATKPSALAAAALMSLSSAGATEAEMPAGCLGKPGELWMTVIAEGMRNDRGLLAITLYADNPKKFLVKRGSIYVARAKAHEGTTRACIKLPEPGVYVIALYHDENANEKIDRSGIGLPTEGFGFSNNPSTIMSLPAFNSVRLAVPRSGLATRIQMKYP